MPSDCQPCEDPGTTMRHGIPVGTERPDAGRTCACRTNDSVCSEPQAGPCASRAHVGQSTLSLGKLRPKDEETASRAHGQRTTHEREVESKSIERAPPFGDLSAEQDPRGFSHPGLKPRPLGSPRRSPQEVADVRGALEGATFGGCPQEGRDLGFARFSKHSSSWRGLCREPPRAPERT